jgi:hypothetical protein
MVETKIALIGQRRNVLFYCGEHGIDPSDKKYILVHGPHSLYGYNCKIKPVWVGPEPSNSIEIFEQIRMLNARFP